MTSLLEVASFGGTSAEDDNREYFLETPVFNTLWEGKRCIVSGRKGSGKSALFLALQDKAKQDQHPYRSATFSHYPWPAHDMYTSNESTPMERYIESWHYFLLIQTFIALNDKTEFLFSPASKPFSEVRKFIKDNYGDTKQNFKKLFPQGGFNVDGINTKFGPIKSVGVDTHFSRSTANLGSVLPRLNEWLEGKLIEIADYMPTTYILFDELDASFDPRDENYMPRLSGLLVATRRFVKWCAQNNTPVRPIVFLRSDIFDSLHFGDLNKIRETNLVELSWNDRIDSMHGESLKALMDFRISKVMGLPGETKDPWKTVFDDRLMRGNQHKFQHIASRTFLRPRDIIKFCNLALEEAKRANAEIISNEHITKARNTYSQYLLRELDDEIYQAENSWEDAIKILRRIEKEKFTRKEFEREYDVESKEKKLTLDPTSMLNLLYHFSIIGYTAGRRTEFRYMNESLSFDIQAKSFRVHRGLKEALGLTEGSSGRK